MRLNAFRDRGVPSFPPPQPHGQHKRPIGYIELRVAAGLYFICVWGWGVAGDGGGLGGGGQGRSELPASRTFHFWSAPFPKWFPPLMLFLL